MNQRSTRLNHRTASLVERATVFVIDSDTQACDALQPLIDSGACRVRPAETAEEFLLFPRELKPACLLTELHLRGCSGLELQKRVLDRTELPVIFMSSHAGVTATAEAMKRGALDFLPKPLIPDLLQQSVLEALDRSRASLHYMAGIQALTCRYQSLSRREREVMSLVVRGRLNKQVGGELGISETTVKAHRGNLMRKMQAASFADLLNMSASLHA